MINRETKVVHTTDRFMKVIFTVIALCLVWLSVKDTRLEPGVALDAQGTYRLSGLGGVSASPIDINLNCRGC